MTTQSKRRLTAAYEPDEETLALLDSLRRTTQEGRDTQRRLQEIRVRRTELVRKLQGKGLTHRRIAKEIGVSGSAVQRLINLDKTNGKTE